MEKEQYDDVFLVVHMDIESFGNLKRAF